MFLLIVPRDPKERCHKRKWVASGSLVGLAYSVFIT